MGNSATRPYYRPEIDAGHVVGGAASAYLHSTGGAACQVLESKTPPPYEVSLNDSAAVLRAILGNVNHLTGSPQLSVCLSLSGDIFKSDDTFTNEEAVALAIKALAHYQNKGTVYHVYRTGPNQWAQRDTIVV